MEFTTITTQARIYSMELENDRIVKRLQQCQKKISSDSIYSTKTEMLKDGVLPKIEAIQHDAILLDYYLKNAENISRYMQWIDQGLEHIANITNEAIPALVAYQGPAKASNLFDLKKLASNILDQVYAFMTSTYGGENGSTVFGGVIQQNGISDFRVQSNLDNTGNITTNYVQKNLLIDKETEIAPKIFVKLGINPYAMPLANLIGGLWKIKSDDVQSGYDLVRSSIGEIGALRAKYALNSKEVEDTISSTQEKKDALINELGSTISILDQKNLMKIWTDNTNITLLYDLIISLNSAIIQSSRRIDNKLADTL